MGLMILSATIVLADDAAEDEPNGEPPPSVEAGDPNAQDPNAQDPNAQDPNAQDPNAQDPNAQDPNAQDPNAQDPEGDPGAPENPEVEPMEGDRELTMAEQLLWLGKWAAAGKVIAELKLTDPDTVMRAELLKYRILVTQGDARGAEALGEKIFQSHQDDALMLGAFAAAISDQEPKSADLELAEKLALRVNEITLEEDADAWELLATIYSRAGKHDRALEALAKMDALAADDEAKRYGQICRLRALLMKKDAAAANALADHVLSALKDDVDGLGLAADVLLEERSAGKELLDMADKFASRAMEVAKDDETKEEVRLLKLRVLLKKKDLPAAKALGDQIFEAAKGDFIKLAPMVTPLMEGEYLSREELGMAKYLTAGANTLKKGEDWMILAFLAQIHLRQGRLDQAIELQKQAVSKSTNEETKTAAQERLDDLQAMAAAPKGSGN